MGKQAGRLRQRDRPEGEPRHLGAVHRDLAHERALPVQHADYAVLAQLCASAPRQRPRPASTEGRRQLRPTGQLVAGYVEGAVVAADRGRGPHSPGELVEDGAVENAARPLGEAQHAVAVLLRHIAARARRTGGKGGSVGGG